VHHDKEEINIDGAYPLWRQRQALIHECMHVVDDVLCCSREEDEIIKRSLIWDQILRENIELFCNLYKEKKNAKNGGNLQG
jgi:hypothetical protein